MSKADHYREEAARARRWAQDAADPEFQRRLSEIAESYEKLAARIEALESGKAPT